MIRIADIKKRNRAALLPPFPAISGRVPPALRIPVDK
jgi:hypothetical protein